MGRLPGRVTRAARSAAGSFLLHGTPADCSGRDPSLSRRGSTGRVPAPGTCRGRVRAVRSDCVRSRKALKGPAETEGAFSFGPARSHGFRSGYGVGRSIAARSSSARRTLGPS
jgi:hypothetical protein